MNLPSEGIFKKSTDEDTGPGAFDLLGIKLERDWLTGAEEEEIEQRRKREKIYTESKLSRNRAALALSSDMDQNKAFIWLPGTDEREVVTGQEAVVIHLLAENDARFSSMELSDFLKKSLEKDDIEAYRKAAYGVSKKIEKRFNIKGFIKYAAKVGWRVVR